ncbi:MAG: hypothetical protein WBJ81_01585 [Rickettsiales bacterium]
MTPEELQNSISRLLINSYQLSPVIIDGINNLNFRVSLLSYVGNTIETEAQLNRMAYYLEDYAPDFMEVFTVLTDIWIAASTREINFHSVMEQ